MNKAILMGRLGKAPELKTTNSGTSYCKFSIATDKWKKGEGKVDPDWHNITVWGKSAENCNQYLQKGSKVLIEGRIETSQWADKNGNTRYSTGIVAMGVTFLDSKSGGQSSQQSQSQGSYDKQDDIPF